jgi:hypothetical protein
MCMQSLMLSGYFKFSDKILRDQRRTLQDRKVLQFRS